MHQIYLFSSPYIKLKHITRYLISVNQIHKIDSNVDVDLDIDDDGLNKNK